MPVSLFGRWSPALAGEEPRVVTLFRAQEGLPADSCALVELHCDERGCPRPGRAYPSAS